MGTIIDGKKLAAEVRERIKSDALELRDQKIIPTLAVVIVGNNKASLSYVNSKHKACLENEINSIKVELAEDISQEELEKSIEELNQDNNVHGILVQLPLPKHIDSDRILEKINVEKDVDGFHPVNVGRLSVGNADLIPCTPLGVMDLIKSTGQEISGKKALVIGRSNIVGKPVANLLLAENATVTIAHSRTADLHKEVREADIIVSCAGVAHLLDETYDFKETALVIDVGNNYKDDKLVGDVDFDAVKEKVGYISPVPGGVGPMTITELMHNTIVACKKQNNL
ncbi:MAG: tetrahydrofolate dehydrogenase/cyclohydrolase catalytic domain-containing protein [Gemella sp.]|nr:tetrahydrofolate dehydrogenase/cyclohydrolase catalytic domain-containing protein [Gemella sp.]